MSKNGISEKFEQVLESFGPNTSYVWDVLQQYLEDPASVNETWQQLFADVVSSGEVHLLQRTDSKKTSHEPLTDTVPAQSNTPKQPVQAPSLAVVRKQLSAISGVAAKIVENMEASLTLPTATSLRVIPVKVLEIGRAHV